MKKSQKLFIKLINITIKFNLKKLFLNLSIFTNTKNLQIEI